MMSGTGTVPGHGSRMKGHAKRQFENWADSYDRSLLNHFLFRPSYVILMEEIARWHAERSRPFRLLDVGCGTGTFVGMLAGASWPVRAVGVDYSPNMCAAARAKTRNAARDGRGRFLSADSEHLPFGNGHFDLITCSNSFHHYPHQQAVIREFHRLLAPGGRLILIDGFRDCIVGWVVYDVIINRVENNVYHAPWPVIDAYFRSAGFHDIRRRKFNFLFPAFATIGDKA